MRVLYEASNTLEAHMILNLLDQAGLSARIDGEYLQGGVGELQTMGLVRVMIEGTDYSEANSIIQEWDRKQPVQKPPPSPTKKSSFGSGLVGLFVGISAMTIYYHTPVTNDGIDYNGDGRLDEKWTYVNYTISKVEIDRNFDGKMDLVYLYDRKGIIDTSSLDEDFNGTFETDIYYEHGSPFSEKTDSTGDGYKDLVTQYKYGKAETTTFKDPKNNTPIKIQRFGPYYTLQLAEVDTTGDGIIDTIFEYNSIGEVIKKFAK